MDLHRHLVVEFVERETYLREWLDTLQNGGYGACDFNPLANLTSLEVIEIGKYLNLDPTIILKEPSDGLSGQIDEEKLGIEYKDIHNYIKDSSIVREAVGEKIKVRIDMSKHKLLEIPTYRP